MRLGVRGKYFDFVWKVIFICFPLERMKRGRGLRNVSAHHRKIQQLIERKILIR